VLYTRTYLGEKGEHSVPCRLDLVVASIVIGTTGNQDSVRFLMRWSHFDEKCAMRCSVSSMSLLVCTVEMRLVLSSRQKHSIDWCPQTSLERWKKVSAPPRCFGQKSAERTLYCLGSTHSIYCQGLSWQRFVHDQRHLKERVLDCSQRPRFKNCDNSVCCCSSLQTPRVSSAKQRRASTLSTNTHTRARRFFVSPLLSKQWRWLLPLYQLDDRGK
jgi:hypothetical protein